MYFWLASASSMGMSDARVRKLYPSDISNEEWPLLVSYSLY